eukprot:2719540-Pleurochrysis_carterae.AAC.1
MRHKLASSLALHQCRVRASVRDTVRAAPTTFAHIEVVVPCVIDFAARRVHAVLDETLPPAAEADHVERAVPTRRAVVGMRA